MVVSPAELGSQRSDVWSPPNHWSLQESGLKHKNTQRQINVGNLRGKFCQETCEIKQWPLFELPGLVPLFAVGKLGPSPWSMVPAR